MHLLPKTTAGKRWAALAAATLVATSVTVLTAGVPAFAIANGEDAEEGAYPFVAALSMPAIVRSDGTQYASACTGALIAPTWLITAGHCIHDGDRNRISGAPRYPVQAVIGRDTMSGSDGTTAEVIRAVQSPTTDVALLELAAPVESIEPLAIRAEEPQQGDEVRLAGWGTTDGVADVSHQPDRLQTAEFEVTRTTANEAYIEATGPDLLTSACAYDSGAPFFTEEEDGEPELVATEITGDSCPHSSEELAARTDVLAGWIAAETGADTR